MQVVRGQEMKLTNPDLGYVDLDHLELELAQESPDADADISGQIERFTVFQIWQELRSVAAAHFRFY
jgi:hypothetical protein